MNNSQETNKKVTQKWVSTPKRNLICNFRAPNNANFEVWQNYKKWCQENGQDICHTTLSLVNGFMKGADGSSGLTTMRTPTQTINIQQTNFFNYQVSKPRRNPIILNCANPIFSGTITSKVGEYYVLGKAREMVTDFSFRDYPELQHDSFRKIVLRLKRGGKVIGHPRRSNPQRYFLPEKIPEYYHASENIAVKHLFTNSYPDNNSNVSKEMSKMLSTNDDSFGNEVAEEVKCMVAGLWTPAMSGAIMHVASVVARRRFPNVDLASVS